MGTERTKRLRHVLSCVRAAATTPTVPPHIVERPQFHPGEHQVEGMDTVRPELGGAAFSDEEARAVALAMPNRGPLRFVDGKVDPQIVDDFNRFGFYVLTGVLGDGEFTQLKSEVDEVIAHADAACEEMPDIGDGGSRQGAIVPQPEPMPREGVAWRHFAREGWQPGMGMSAAAPLATDANPSGRNPSAMDQPDVPTGLEHRRVLRSIMSWGRLSEAAFALQGHPGLLSLVEAILGEAFTVFGGVHSELLIKAAHLGPSVAWHQVRHPFLTGAPPFLAERGSGVVRAGRADARGWQPRRGPAPPPTRVQSVLQPRRDDPRDVSLGRAAQPQLGAPGHPVSGERARRAAADGAAGTHQAGGHCLQLAQHAAR